MFLIYKCLQIFSFLTNIYKACALLCSMSNKNILEIKEGALEKINSLQKLEPDFVLSWLGGLTDLEQKIVSNLYQINKAVTIKEIMDKIILNTSYGNVLRETSALDFPFKSYFELDTKLQIKLKSLPPAPVREVMLKKEFKFPSFRRVDKSIQDLISMGIVNAREGKLENAKIKGLYYLNPIIRSQLNRLKNEGRK